LKIERHFGTERALVLLRQESVRDPSPNAS
jgi:hypothetical protein